MQLSPHFELSEFVVSETAARLGIDNTPPPAVVEKLRYVALCLEGIRTVLGKPIVVTSGYRCPKLNKAIGSKPTSQHLKGEAADWTCPGFGTPKQIVDYLRHVNVCYDQIILEYGQWVHASFVRSGARMQALVIDESGTHVYA
jgi:hypothetical protein